MPGDYTPFATRVDGVDSNHASDINAPNVALGRIRTGRYHILNYNGVGDGVTDDAAHLVSTDSANAGTGVSEIPSGNWRVASNTTLAHALTLPPGALLKPDSGVTLTLVGTLDAGPYQVFGGAGSVVLGAGIEYARPEWWGGKADGGVTDNRAAFDKMLASGCKNFRLMPGNYGFATADASGNGVTIAITGAEFVGAGYARTTLTFTCAVTWGVKATAAQTHCRGFTVAIGSGGSAVYSVGVSTASTGSAESCAFVDILEGTAGSGTITNGFAVGPDNPGSSTMDIAETTFLRCRANGPHSNAGFLIGNGTVGNILANQMLHCTALSGKYGVYGNASGFVWRDGTTAANTDHDFAATTQGTDPIVIDGVRSELSAALWYMNGGTVAANVSIRSVDFFATNIVASGKWIEHNVGGLFEARNVACLTAGAVAPIVWFNAAALLVANLAGVASQTAFATAFQVTGMPAGSMVAVSGYVQLNADETMVAVTPFSILGPNGGGGQIAAKALGSGVSIKEGANAKQGVATLVAGTVTVSNTAVTASSRIQLTAQDNNTTGALRVSARTAGTSFAITSSVGTDTGVVAYEIFEPA